MGALIGVALALLFVASGFVVSSPQVCGGCHEMQTHVATWKVSPHSNVGCYSCHGIPQPWYRAPRSSVERWTFVARDMRARFVARSQGTTDLASGASSSMPEAVCEQCHDPSRKGTYRFGLIIDHAEHAKRNKSCVSCHLWTAHPVADPNRAPSLLMARCFNCHGLGKEAKASGECDACHRKGVDLKPASHKQGDWQTRHSKAATIDRQQCAMCHRPQFCTDCHGVEMPHPADWAKGKTGHSAVAQRNRAVCAKCHEGKASLCTMCHHTGFDQKKGPWVSQHFLMVRQVGAAYCFACHNPVFCATCHVAGSASRTAP